MVVKSLKYLTILFSCIMSHDLLLLDPWCRDPVCICISYLACTVYLPDTDMLITWHLISYTLYLICYHLTHGY